MSEPKLPTTLRETFEADAETEAMLLASITQCEQGQTVPWEQVLDDLRRRE
jgi:hypothetical protein